MLKCFLKWISVILPLLLHEISYGNNSPIPFDLENVEISIITCDPGSEVYSLFGHSALRINHVESDEDIVVNWGIFEYYEDQFKFGYDFAKGRLNYYMGIQNTVNFLREYSFYKRGVREQILNLTTSEKKEIIEFIFQYLLNFVREFDRAVVKFIIPSHILHNENNIEVRC